MTPLNPDPLIPDGPEYDEPDPRPGITVPLTLLALLLVVAAAVAWFALNGGSR